MGKMLNSGAGVVIICGIVFMLIGFAVPMLVNNSERAEAYTATADGVVTRVQEKVSRKKGRKSTSYISFVRFEDSDHREFVSRCIAIARSQRHKTGDKVSVRYDPMSPGDGCLIVGDEDILRKEDLLTLLLRAGGFATILVGVVLMVRRYRMLAEA